ncbi:MAG: C2 family cysteine protease, partial [Myxococcales bacterium]
LLGITTPVTPSPVTPAPVQPAPVNPAPVRPAPVQPAPPPPVQPAPPPPANTDISDPTVLTKHEGTTWGKVEGGRLFVDGVSYDDVVQGSIANCYMVAAFSSVAQADPKLIENAMKDNGDGTYTVRFYEKSGYSTMKPVYVTVDGDLPTNGTQSSRYAKGRDGKELWVGLLEKAYAQWKGGYEAIGNGGISGDVMTALTGKNYGYTSTSYSTPEQVFSRIQQGAAAKRPMAAGTHGKDDGVDYTGTGVYAWHAYTVLGAVEENGVKYVQLRNPWGKSEHNPDGVSDGKDDGIFKMKVEDFMKLYSGLTVSY